MSNQTEPKMRKKRTLNAFQLYMNSVRDSIKNDLGKKGPFKMTDVNKEGGSRWRKLKESASSSDKKLVLKFQEDANKLKENAPMVEVLPKKVKKDKSSRPKKPPTTYNLFMKSMYPVMAKKHPEEKFLEVSKRVSTEWKRLNASSAAKDKKVVLKFQKMKLELQNSLKSEPAPVVEKKEEKTVQESKKNPTNKRKKESKSKKSKKAKN